VLWRESGPFVHGRDLLGRRSMPIVALTAYRPSRTMRAMHRIGTPVPATRGQQQPSTRVGLA
jgi:hypothetical protein